MSTHSKIPGLANAVAMVRDQNGAIVPVYRRTGDAAGLTDGRTHVRAVNDERGRAQGRVDRTPLHSLVRDVRTSNDSVAARLVSEIPEAAQIVRDYGTRQFKSRADAEHLEERYYEITRDWRNDYLRTRRTDADSLYLQLETVASLGKMIEITYEQPSIEDAFPVTVLGTELTSARGLEKELTWELPVFGVDVSISGLPTASVRRGERFYNLVHVKAGAEITDEELARFKEISAGYPEDFDFDLWDERLRGAALAVQFGVGCTVAYGRPQNQIDGLFRRKDALPAANYDFTTNTPVDNVAAISALIADQFAQVNNRLDMQADSLALSPSIFMKLSQQPYNVGNASNASTMEMIMRYNPTIKTIYQIREMQPSAQMATRLQQHGMDATEAEINSGGMRVDGTQRNAAVAYRRDPRFVEILKGFNLRTTVYPAVNGHTQAKLVESCGGLLVHQPQTIRIAYEDAP